MPEEAGDMKADEFISAIDDEEVIRAIQKAESRTSGEIRVLVTGRKVEDPVREAWKQFARLKMDRTEKRNGVLILIAPVSRSFAVVGDEGIHRCCEDSFWRTLASRLAEGFKAGGYTGALVRAIEDSGLELSRHFPGGGENKNELSDEVVRDRHGAGE